MTCSVKPNQMNRKNRFRSDSANGLVAGSRFRKTEPLELEKKKKKNIVSYVLISEPRPFSGKGSRSTGFVFLRCLLREFPTDSIIQRRSSSEANLAIFYYLQVKVDLLVESDVFTPTAR